MPPSARRRAALLALLWATLGAWLAVMLFFGAVVAPAAFRVLPSPGAAGDLVGRVLGPVHGLGAAAGVLLAVLGAALRRGPVTIALPLLLAALCLFNHFGVSPAVAEIRFQDLQPGDAERFRRLHQLSVGVFCAVGVGILGLLALHARRDRVEGGGERL